MTKKLLPFDRGLLTAVLLAGVGLPCLALTAETVTGIWIGILTVFLVALAPMFVEWRQGRLDPLQPRHLFVLYYSAQLGGYMAYVLISGPHWLPWLKPDRIDNIKTYSAVMAATTIGLAAFYWGYSLKLGSAIGRQLPSFPCWRQGRVNWIVVGCLAVSLGASYLFLAMQGGLGSFLVNLAAWRTLDLVGQGYLTYPATSLLPPALLLALVVALEKRSSRIKIGAILFLFAVSLIPTLLTGFRAGLVPPVLQLASVWHYGYRPIPLKKVAALGLVFLALLAAYGTVRGMIESRGDVRSIGTISVAALVKPLVSRSPGAEMVATEMQQLAANGQYRYWWDSLVETLTILVPHRVWPEKPLPQGFVYGLEIMRDYLFMRDGVITERTGGFTPTTVGYFYWQMGWAGVVIGMFALGLMTRAADAFLKADPHSASRLFLYTTLVGAFPFFAESPQDAANGLFIRMTFASAFLFLLTVRLPLANHQEGTTAPASSGEQKSGLDARCGHDRL